MPLSDGDINLLMEFQQLHVPNTGGARKYFLLNVMYEISQRFWTLAEVKARYRAYGNQTFLSNLREMERPVLQPKDAGQAALKQMVDIGILAMRMKAYGDKMLNEINKTSKLFYARIPDNDVVLLMGDNSEMQTAFDEGNTFDIQRPHFDANFTFEVIPEEIEAVLTAIVALTKCSKTWFLCKGTPQQIVKAASGDVVASARKILNILQNFQVASDLFISDFKEQQDWPAQEPGFFTVFSPSSVHHAGMPKLRENLQKNKPEFKLICQFALVSICDDTNGRKLWCEKSWSPWC
jgi:hypothetical protein